MSSPETRRRRRVRRPLCAPDQAPTRGGFTLIEVLAAVALLGILYGVLARVAIEGLRAEGDSARRLEASLIADEAMSSLIGAPAPPVGRTQTQQRDFTITMEVSPFTLPPQWGLEDAGEASAPLLLKSEQGGGTQALRTILISVSWLEGGNERSVSRTFFMLDFQTVGQVASAVGASGATPTAGVVGEAPSGGAPPPSEEEPAESEAP